MKFSKFVWYSFLGGVFWSATLVLMGYFFGYLYEEIVEYIKYAGWIIFGVAITIIIGMNLYKKRKGEKLIGEK